jgi:hypothetical protein
MSTHVEWADAAYTAENMRVAPAGTFEDSYGTENDVDVLLLDTGGSLIAIEGDRGSFLAMLDRARHLVETNCHNRMDCKHCHRPIKAHVVEGYFHTETGLDGCGLLPGEVRAEGEESKASAYELYATPETYDVPDVAPGSPDA